MKKKDWKMALSKKEEREQVSGKVNYKEMSGQLHEFQLKTRLAYLHHLSNSYENYQEQKERREKGYISKRKCSQGEERRREKSI